MISNIIFDFDGVICDVKPLHFIALNEALKEYGYQEISLEQHLYEFDGLSTYKKLEKLEITDKKTRDKIWDYKQEITSELVKQIRPQQHIIDLLNKLTQNKYVLSCCSNSMYSSLKNMLTYSGCIDYFDKIYSNEDVNEVKPNPEIYLRCMAEHSVGPKETLIIEDSPVGLQAAYDSMAHVLRVKNSSEVNILNVYSAIKKAEGKTIYLKKPASRNMNVLIPMSGRGSRFEQAGYTMPKPLIDTINGKPMIQMVVDNLNIDANYIFIVQKEHYEKYNLGAVLRLIKPGCNIVQVEGVTEGAACSSLLAKEYINNDLPLLISNSDQYMHDFDSENFLYFCENSNIDGCIGTFYNTNSKWSYAAVDKNGFVTRVAEKEPISMCATTGGAYWYKKGSDYVEYTEKMIASNDRVNNEFYIAPVYNYFIKDGKKIKTYHTEHMVGCGTPEDLAELIRLYGEKK